MDSGNGRRAAMAPSPKIHLNDVDVGCLLVVFCWCVLFPILLAKYSSINDKGFAFFIMYHLFPVGFIFLQLTEDTQETMDSLPYPSLPKWVKAAVVFVCMDLFLFFCYYSYTLDLPRKYRECRKSRRRQQRRPPPAPVVVGLSVGELEEQRVMKEQEEEYLRLQKLGEGVSSTSSVGVDIVMVDVKA